MSGFNQSRRSALKKIAVGGAAALAGSKAHAQVQVPAEECDNGVGFQKMAHAVPVATLGATRINDEPVKSQASPGDFAAERFEHEISIGFWICPVYNQAGAIQNRHFLTVDVGANPAMGVWHPVAYGSPTQINTITDIYVFDRDNNELLYWKQVGALDKEPSTMITLDEGDVAAARNIKVVTRCTLHGFWGRDFRLENPVSYANALPALDAGQIFSGTTIHRPLSPADPSVDGNQGLGDLHRTRFDLVNNDTLLTAIGAGHPHVETHYIMGGAIFDQNGNVLAPPQHITFQENIVQVGFNNLQLSQRGVRTVRGIMFDTLQGVLMSVFDLP